MYHQYPTPSSAINSSMSVSGIQGQLLEVTVVGCNKLKDTEWISRQDPYVCIEYGTTKFRTRTCTDGGKNPTFQEKFVFTLIEGLPELLVVVWNSNTITYDDYIGNGKVQLQKILCHGYDDTAWPLQTKTGRHAGEVRLILHYANANKPATIFAPSAPPYAAAPPAQPQVSPYAAPPPAFAAAPYLTPSAYPGASPYPSYPQNSAAYPPSPYPPPQPTAYPSQPYPPSSYPPQPYPPSTYPPQPQPYPPSTYPPQPYPPPPQASPYYSPGPYPGLYPPPPY